VWDEHRHSEMQVLYFGAGSDCMIHWMQDGAWTTRHVQGPSLWVIGASMIHKLEWRKPALRLVFYMQPDFAAGIAGVEINGSSLFSIEAVGRCDPRIPTLLLDFEKLDPPKTEGESVHVESLGSLVSVHICNAWTCLTRPAEAWATIQGNETIAKIDALIERRIEEKIRLVDMTREVGMSKSSFMRLFKTRTGMTPAQYLIDKRIQKSKTLLISKNWTIGGIASEVGFSNQGHFDFFFKRHTGMTPKEYRLMHNTDPIS
jgi:AraC family transcriptional regulator